MRHLIGTENYLMNDFYKIVIKKANIKIILAFYFLTA